MAKILVVDDEKLIVKGIRFSHEYPFLFSIVLLFYAFITTMNTCNKFIVSHLIYQINTKPDIIY